jgi:hypothetical protein
MISGATTVSEEPVIDCERELGVATRTPDPCIHDDQVPGWIEARYLHKKKRGTGAFTGPVK